MSKLFHADNKKPLNSTSRLLALCWLLITPFTSTLLLAASCDVDCTVSNTCGTSVDPADGSLPLASIGDLTYEGAFRMSTEIHGESQLNYSQGVFSVEGNSIFIVGHRQQQAIAEFEIPPLSMGTTVESLNSAGAPIQPFSRLLNRVTGGNSQSIDYITGMETYNGSLIVNATEYYDAEANSTDTTVVVSNNANIAGSPVAGFYRLPGGARSGGWMSKLPPEWEARLGKTHIAGNASGTTSIMSRHSIGPSAHAVNASDVINANPGSAISTDRLMEFSLASPLASDLYNDSRENDLWTEISQAIYGFVIPGTRTYATFGSSGGHVSGLGYKITQNNGTVCGGPCSYDARDVYNYYWLWDMNDLLAVKQGDRSPSSIRPYAYGKFDAPFQVDGFNRIGGASYDESTNRLYFSINSADHVASIYTYAPVIVAYQVAIR